VPESFFGEESGSRGAMRMRGFGRVPMETIDLRQVVVCDLAFQLEMLHG
jgi:hypothetical protein